MVLHGAGRHRILEDTERPVLPAAPVAAHHQAGWLPEPTGAPAKPLADEVLCEHLAQRLGPEVLVGAAVAPDGDRPHGLGADGAGVVVGARTVSRVAKAGIGVAPARRARPGLRAERFTG